MHHSCREKKDTEVQCLETTKDGEAENLGGIEKENEELRETLVKLKNHYAKVCISNEVYITNETILDSNLGLDNINIMFFFIFEGFGICEKEQHRAKTKKYPWNALHGWIQPWRQ